MPDPGPPDSGAIPAVDGSPDAEGAETGAHRPSELLADRTDAPTQVESDPDVADAATAPAEIERFRDVPADEIRVGGGGLVPVPQDAELSFDLPKPPPVPRMTAAGALAAAAVLSTAPDAPASQLTVEQQERATNALEDVYRELYAALQKTKNGNALKELASFVPLLPDLPSLADPYVVYQAQVAIRSLAANDPYFRVAAGIRKDIERRIRAERRSRWPAAIWLLLGLLGFLYLPALASLGIAFGVSQAGTDAEPVSTRLIAGIPLETLFWVAISGSFGAIVSIMVRIDRFNRGVLFGQRIVLIATGFFKPFIGAAFGGFIYVAVMGGVVPISVPADTRDAFFVALGFLAGFSERLVPDIAQRVDKKYLDALSPETTT